MTRTGDVALTYWEECRTLPAEAAVPHILDNSSSGGCLDEEVPHMSNNNVYVDAIQAVIYIPGWADLIAAERSCLETAGTHGVHPDTLARDWQEVARLVHSDQLDLLIVASRDHLPPGRLPRIVAADDYDWTTPPPATAGRPAILRSPSRGGPSLRRPSVR